MLCTALLLLAVLVVPVPSLKNDYSHVVYANDGSLLSATIAQDGQWRFQLEEELPKDFVQSVLQFEDEYFFLHPGVNPVSLIKACYINFKEKRIIRGGSTITMQVMRMYRGNRQRTIWQKAIEILGALKLELFYSKEKILKIWAGIAPFGGNVVGVQTASRFYFDRPLSELSHSEYAALAVLPNAPSEIHLNKNRVELKLKRNDLLQKLFQNNKIDSVTYELSIEEDLPDFQHKINQQAIHLLEHLKQENPKQSFFNSTIDPYLQSEVTRVVNRYSHLYQHDGINNAAAIVVHNQSNEVLAYLGNSAAQNGSLQYVNCVLGQRSYGSLLKPVLYAYAIENGYFLPFEHVKDIPTNIDGFVPRNFDRSYRGIVSFDQVVSQSLNIPAVRTLNYVGVESFHSHLRNQLYFNDLNSDPHYYGLSIILGGAEASLWDMSRLYKGLVQDYYGNSHPFQYPYLLQNESPNSKFSNKNIYNKKVGEYMFQSMQSLNRPREEQQYHKYAGQEIAWKTGTSYGHKDAWSIGCTKDYTVAVWVGNEDGKGRFELTGVEKAAPILFEIFRLLGQVEGIEPTAAKAEMIEVCFQSGRLAGTNCKQKEWMMIHKTSHQLRNCDLHEFNSIAQTIEFREDPVAEYYYRQFYGIQSNTNVSLSFVYPVQGSVIQSPFDSEKNEIVIQASVSNTNSNYYWYLDQKFVAKTTDHQMMVNLGKGNHTLFVTNQFGEETEVDFFVE